MLPRGQSPRAVVSCAVSCFVSLEEKHVDSSIPGSLGSCTCWFFWSPCIQVRRRTHLHLPLFSLTVEVLQELGPQHTYSSVFTVSPSHLICAYSFTTIWMLMAFRSVSPAGTDPLASRLLLSTACSAHAFLTKTCLPEG